MTRVGMHEAKTQLSRLVERARGGEEVIVERSGARSRRSSPTTSSRVA